MVYTPQTDSPTKRADSKNAGTITNDNQKEYLMRVKNIQDENQNHEGYG